jgi:hypothetical protein
MFSLNCLKNTTPEKLRGNAFCLRESLFLTEIRTVAAVADNSTVIALKRLGRNSALKTLACF